MSWPKSELLVLVRAAYEAGRAPRETVELLRRHLAFREAETAFEPPPWLRLLPPRTGRSG